MTTYDRDVLREVVIYHYKSSIEGCRCGYAKLGACNSEHVADEYEKAMAAKQAPRLSRVKITNYCGKHVGILEISVHDGIRYDPPLRVPAECRRMPSHPGDCSL